MTIKAMKQALDALELWSPALGHALNKRAEAVVALRAAIEQSEKPWVKTYAGGQPNFTAPEEPVCAHGVEKTKCPFCQPPKQEPVAWTTMPDDEDWLFISGTSDPNGMMDGKWNPLYTAPPRREWQGLTDEEKHQLNDALNLQGRFPIIDAIEAKLKERNK